MSLREYLKQWRISQSREEGIEVFRVFPNAVLENIALSLPRTKDELMAIKGIKEAKYRKYGKAILALVDAHAPLNAHFEVTSPFKGNLPASTSPLERNLSASTSLSKARLSSSTSPLKGEGREGMREDSLLYRRQLRAEATPQEVILWSRLRGEQMGWKFRRQHPVGKYILDFYCPAKKLAIEVDGAQHKEYIQYDAERTAFLKQQGIWVLRFWNNEVNTHIEGVLLEIERVLHSSPQSPPQRGGEAGEVAPQGIQSAHSIPSVQARSLVTSPLERNLSASTSLSKARLSSSTSPLEGNPLAFTSLLKENLPVSTSPLKGEGREGMRETPHKEELPLSISQFLDGLNIELSGMAARIKGEVSSVDERERVIYFTLKDSEDGSTLNCLIFRSQYQLSGVALSIGDEIVVLGAPDIYKPSGRLSFKVEYIELAGEGALKKAYDALSRTLEQEGLFAPDRKRALPLFPERIALITSEQGAAIGDFTMNLGQLGVKVDFYPASVEGMRAVVDILEALRYFSKRSDRYDLLVMIRGGGSLESLQAFNNETLVREVALCPIPTLLGIGHEKDITLAALVADVMVSTPTATARTLREPFERARQMIGYAVDILASQGERAMSEQHTRIGRAEQAISLVFPKIAERFTRAEQNLFRALDRIAFVLLTAREQCTEAERLCLQGYSHTQSIFVRSLTQIEEKLREYDPHRVLLLGYSLVRSGKRLVRSVADVERGERLSIQVRDGTIETEVQ